MGIESTAASNYSPYTGAYTNFEGLAIQHIDEARKRAISESIQNIASIAASPSSRPGGHTGGFIAGAFNLAAASTQNKTVQTFAQLGSGINSVVNQLSSRALVPTVANSPGALVDSRGQAWRSIPMPGRGFSAAGAGLGMAAELTNNALLGAAGQLATGVGDTINAAKLSGPAAGITTGLGAAFGFASGLLKGAARKVASVFSQGFNTAGNILSGATNVASGLISGAAGIVGTLIGGKTGQKISSGASVVTGALMMAANPVMGVISILGGLFGLFGKGKKVSKLTEQMAADFKGDSTMNDVVVRAPKGDKNTLQIKLTDDLTGQSREVQKIKIDGWFNKKDQSRQQQTVDVNGDGKHDIVWQDKNRISVFLNRGDGTFGNANFVQTRHQAADAARATVKWAAIVDVLAGVEKANQVDGWEGESASSEVAYGGDALKDLWRETGGVARNGAFHAWGDKFVKDNNLNRLKTEYATTGGSAAHGSLMQFVAARLETKGVVAPKNLSEFSSQIGSNRKGLAGAGEAGLSGWMADRARALQGAKYSSMRISAGRGVASSHWSNVIGAGGSSRFRPPNASPVSLRASANAFVAQSVQNHDAQFLGTRSSGAYVNGSGVSLATQVMDVNVTAQKPGQLFFWDINGDTVNDMVLSGEGVKGSKAFLNNGDGTFSNDAIDLDNPTEQDFGQLVLQDITGVQFINADLYGRGQRTQAIQYGGIWMQLPPQESVSPQNKE
jgi:hypothetical protein